jgi:hypothetical protein
MGVYDPQVQAMRKMGFTEEEIADVLKCDKEIDRGANLFPLDEEQEKASKKARSVPRGVGVYKFSQPKRKADTDKRDLINQFAEMVENVADGGVVEIINPEREFLFTYNGRKFKITLSAPRK